MVLVVKLAIIHSAGQARDRFSLEQGGGRGWHAYRALRGLLHPDRGDGANRPEHTRLGVAR